MSHDLMTPAIKIAETLAPLSTGKLPQEVIVLNAEMVSVVAEIGGVDYILTVMKVPRQRAKPATQ